MGAKDGTILNFTEEYRDKHWVKCRRYSTDPRSCESCYSDDGHFINRKCERDNADCDAKWVDDSFKTGHLMASITQIRKTMVVLKLAYGLGEITVNISDAKNILSVREECDIQFFVETDVLLKIWKQSLEKLKLKDRRESIRLFNELGIVTPFPYKNIPNEAYTVKIFLDKKRTFLSKVYDAKWEE